jgi:rfaE bifunctional protein kinase chain/domain
VDPAQLAPLIDALRGRAVAVVGDVVADEFVYGRVARVSREAPVLILEYDSTEVVPGAGGNAASNIAALGGQAVLVSVIGRDEPGRRLMAALPPGVVSRFVQRAAGYRTTVKTRILAGGIHSAKQQVVRIDRAVGQPYSRAVRAAFERAALSVVTGTDAVLVSDYGSGLVTPRFVATIARHLAKVGHPIPILVDTRYRLLEYRGLTACTPNESEVEQALGIRINDDQRMLERAGREILERTGMQAVLITRGSRGMALFLPGEPTEHIPIHGTDEIADVTGAGDTVMATLALALAAGAPFAAAAHLANRAGGLVVMKRGTATVSAAELQATLREPRQASAEPAAARRTRTRRHRTTRWAKS